MKKILLFVALLTMGWLGVHAQDCEDGPYGLQINGETVVDAPKFGDADLQGRVQYKAACVDLKVGDVVKLINLSCGATWMVDLDQFGAFESFEGGRKTGQLTCNVAGQYDFYIKLSIEAGDLVYVGPAGDCNTPGWDIPSGDGCQDGPYAIQINGADVVGAPVFGEPDAQGRAQYKVSCTELKAGDVVKLINLSCDATWMVDLDKYGAFESFEGGKEAGQLTCNVAGNYDFYIKLSSTEGDLVYVEISNSCEGEGYEGQPGESGCQDGPYGIQINGGRVVEAPLFGEPDAQNRVQYKAACLELKADDVIKLINLSCDATWMVDLDQFGAFESFFGGREAGQLTCKAAGSFDAYIKLSADQGDILYIGPAENCGSGNEGGNVGEGDCQDGPYGLKINESKTVNAPLFGEPDAQGRVQYRAVCVELKAGDKVKLANFSCDATWMVDLDPFGQYENFEGGKVANELVCNVAGNYDFYIKLSSTEGDLVYVETSQNCGGGGDEPIYANSVPERCPDVLLQAFYWDSNEKETVAGSKTAVYGRTKWVDFLNKKGADGEQSVAEEMGQWFDMIWLPPMSSSTGGTGYLPIQYSNLECDWGTNKKLTQLIETLHKNGSRVIADVVINHISGQKGWCQFATQNFGKFGVFEPDVSWICNTDEMNWPEKEAEAGNCYGLATGNPDDGYGLEANYDSGRDWDHTNSEVQKMMKAYLNWLRDVVKVDGFRYDYCKGFHNKHIGNYNAASKAYFSVMEMWDGDVNSLIYHLNEANWNTSTFDFATKYTAFNGGIASGNYARLKGAGLLGAGQSRYAVTFLDSHDSFLRDDNEFCGEGNSMTICREKVPQCYAYLLSMPGVPLVFWPHWVAFKEPIKMMINARYKTGVHSQSQVSDEAGDGFYKATITGTNGQIRLLLGPNSGYNTTPAGFQLASKGVNYGVYYKMNSPRGDKNTERIDRTFQAIEVVNTNGERVQAMGEKFIQNGQLFIRCGDYIFNIMGGRVK